MSATAPNHQPTPAERVAIRIAEAGRAAGFRFQAPPEEAKPKATHRPTVPAADASRADWAGYFHRLGFKLCAIPPGKKGPNAEGWPEADVRDEHWQACPREGIGVVLGPSRLVSLDLDPLAACRT